MTLVLMKKFCYNHKVCTSSIGMIAMASIFFYGCFEADRGRNNISVPDAIDTTAVKKEIITLDHVFNVLHVSKGVRTILTALSIASFFS